MSDDTDDDVPDEFPVTDADSARLKYENRAVEDNRKYNDARNAKRKAERIRKNEIKARMAADPDYVPEAPVENRGRKRGEGPTQKERTADWDIQLRILEKRTRGNPTDADGDIDFAYRNMALQNVVPKMAPSLSAWSWYVFARTEPNEFLKICHRREDAKAKMAGTITNQRMEDDKRNQFAVIDRIEKALTVNVRSVVTELMQKFPRDVLEVCYGFESEWKSFLVFKDVTHPDGKRVEVIRG